MLLGSGVDAKIKDAIRYPNFLRFRKFPITSKFVRCWFGTNFLNRWLIRFKTNLPMVAPVAPTRASKNGLRLGSKAKKEERIIQDGGIRRGATLTPIKSRKIPK